MDLIISKLVQFKIVKNEFYSTKSDSTTQKSKSKSESKSRVEPLRLKFGNGPKTGGPRCLIFRKIFRNFSNVKKIGRKGSRLELLVTWYKSTLYVS